MIGTMLGPYRVLEKLGEGGMGEVYKARDTRLDRTVAIKVLTPEFSADSDRRARFEREAKAIAALSHPHICTLYDVGEHPSTGSASSPQAGSGHAALYLVMEHLSGETLAARLERGPLPLDQALAVAAEIADALAAAHRQGVIHRDLKPGNVMLTKAGVKLLDFGLAKLTGHGEQPAAAHLASAPTQSTPLTGEGMIIGTLQYMAPEQLEGKPVDARTDLWALGAIVHEMVTGRRPFEGAAPASLIAAILATDPPALSQLQPMAPPGLERTVRVCLAKNPDERFQTAHDAKLALEWARGDAGSPTIGTTAPVVPRRRGWLPWAVGSVAVMVAALLGYALGLRSPHASGRRQFAIAVPGEVSYLAISADGRYLAFVSPDEDSGTNMILVQRLGSPEARLLPGTEGASHPFWSPDDASVGFFAQGKMKKVAIAGGAPQPMATVRNARGGSWGRGDVILYAPNAGGALWRINADGSGARPAGDVLADGEVSHRWPVLLPDGEHYLYWGGNFEEQANEKVNGICLASLSGGKPVRLVSARSNAGYGAGNLFYVDERGSLVHAPLDAAAGKLTGPPQVLATAVAYSAATHWGAFAVSQNASVVYSTSPSAALSVLTWCDRGGKELGRTGDLGVIGNPAISPDGTRVLVDINDMHARNVDLWLDNVKSGSSSRFTFNPAEETTGVWSHDGRMIAFRSGGSLLQLKEATGLQAERTLVRVRAADEIMPNSWSADDAQILCSVQSPASSAHGDSQLVLVSVADGRLTPFMPGPASLSDGQISPDGRWVAYASNETGDWEIYVTTFPGAVGKWQVSHGGGAEPRWSPDGRHIYYLGPKGMLTGVPVETAGDFSVGVPQQLFQIHGRAPISSADLFSYDVSADGRRFLVNRYVTPATAPPLNIILNATAQQ